MPPFFLFQLICLVFKINNFIINLAYMLIKKSNQQKKRSLSNSKNGSNHKKILKLELLKAYGANSSSKKINNKTKSNKLVLNTSDKSKSKIDKSDYEFPQFSIVFREGESKRNFDKCRKQKKAKNKVPLTERSQVSCFNQLTINSKPKGSIIKLNEKSRKVQSTKSIQVTPKQQFQNLQTNYRYCLKKVFKLLDIFNRGSISQININKWIPEAALYFLGKIFQKIRIQRLTLNQQQFINLCFPLFKQSSLEDVQWFIKKTQSHSYSKQQISIPQATKQQLSPIQRRTIEENLLKSHLNHNKQQKNIQFSNVIEKIKIKESEVKQKLNQAKFKRKSVHFNILSEINPNQISHNRSINQQKYEGLQFNLQNQKDTTQSPLRNSQKEKEKNKQLIENGRNRMLQDIANKDNNNPYIPNFTFQLPKIPQVISENDSIQNVHSSKIGALEQTFRIKFQKSQESSQVIQPLSARFLSRNIEDSRIERSKQKYKLASDEDKRIDHLTKKLQRFLQLNAEKIQHNKSFFIENRQNKKIQQ